MHKYRQPPIGEPERSCFHFKSRARAYKHVIYDEDEFGEESNEEKETGALA